jgi:ERCC4-related helicase
MAESTTFAPGARLLIRDEEWLVKSTLPIRTGGAAVRAVGLSELVRGHEAVFLTELDHIAELKPEETKLVTDDSPQYRRSRLYLESLLRRTPPTDDRIYLGHNGALDYAPYQVQPAHMALKALRPRILIADGVGLGKTIEAGILLSELIKRGRGERILVVATRSMLTQFQQEIWARFAIPLVRLDSVGLRRVRAKIPSNKNPFYYYNRVIISVDTLKNDAQYRHYLEQCHWDVIVIDECHNVANLGSERNRLAALLARTCDGLILTSATPHNGRAESFANLMNMLEPTAIADSSNYTAEDISGLFVRRFKKDIEDQVAGQFSERAVKLVKVDAGEAEEAFFSRLAACSFHTLDRGRSQDELYRIGLLKGFLSSPVACVQSIDGRVNKIGKRLAKLRGEQVKPEEDDEGLQDFAPELFESVSKRQRVIADLAEDHAALTELKELASAVTSARFIKFGRLVKLLRELGADASPASPRVIVFSERIATLAFLLENLQDEFRAYEGAIVQFHAGLPDIEQQDIVESFGKEDSPMRILLASDVASEGVNLHYYCHLMIHFDIPWSLITLEQRNGRIDRFGQTQSPLIYYLLTLSKDETIRGDLRVLDRLIEKEQEAHKNIGDAATILGLHDAQKEEEYIAQALAAGKGPDEIFPIESPEKDWLALLMQAAEQTEVEDVRTPLPTLYKDDLDFARAAFDELLTADPALPAPEYHPQRSEFTFLAPEDLRRRCEFIPQEAIPADWTFCLTTDRTRVMKAIAEARKHEREWPQAQLFWELHPVMEWLTDKLLVRFGRHEAPVILTPKLGKKEVILLFEGVLSNKRSQPLITEWFGLLHAGRSKWELLDLDAVLKRAGFAAGLPNVAVDSDRTAEIARVLPGAVAMAREYMDGLRLERGQTLGNRLRDDQRKLKRWCDAALKRFAELEVGARGAQAARVAHERNEAKALYEQRQTWLNDTLTSVPTPYLRLALVFSGS